MANSQNRKYKIMYFEDDASHSGLYGTKLKIEGFEVVVYESPTLDPVGAVVKVKPDLIMMDLIMPVMDGFDAIKLLKKDERTKNIPIIILSNLGQRDEVEKGLALGAADYFVKIHYMPSDLVEKVKYHLNNSKH